MEQLLGGFIEEANRSDFTYNFDSFRVETASRKILTEMATVLQGQFSEMNSKYTYLVSSH